jgi:hypothetical protein
MLSGTTWLLSLVILRETYPLIILAKKVKKLRKECNAIEFYSRLDTGKLALKIYYGEV